MEFCHQPTSIFMIENCYLNVNKKQFKYKKKWNKSIF